MCLNFISSHPIFLTKTFHNTHNTSPLPPILPQNVQHAGRHRHHRNNHDHFPSKKKTWGILHKLERERFCWERQNCIKFRILEVFNVPLGNVFPIVIIIDVHVCVLLPLVQLFLRVLPNHQNSSFVIIKTFFVLVLWLVFRYLLVKRTCNIAHVHVVVTVEKVIWFWW